jgi:tricorn protease
MIAWTSGRGGPPEVFLADVEGGDARRLTYWGDPQTRVSGWDRAGAILVVSAAGQPFSQFTWAYAISADGGSDGNDGNDGVRGGPRRLAFGPVSDLSVESAGVALLSGTMGR